MAISFRRYVEINSGVGAGSPVSRRDLIGRIFTASDLLPTNSFVEMTTAGDVATFFGANSDEHRRALFYFGFISKNTTSASRISFARWANVDTAPRIIGAVSNTLLTTFQAITDGAFDITIGAVTTNVTGLDFSSAASFADVATAIQTAVRGGTGTVFTNATVTYDATVPRFVLVGGETGANTIELAAPASGTDIRAVLGWAETARLSNGVVAETVSGVLATSSETSNNFGSFAFIPTLDQAQIVEAATFADASNVAYTFCARVTATTATAVSTAISALAGNAMTLANDTHVNEYPELVPMIVEAATNYEARAYVQNYMFQIFNLTPTVVTNAEADLYDGLRVNYYGQTQTAGQSLNFYQRGVLTGTVSDPTDMNTYANEKWLKDAAGAALMGLLLSTARVPANDEGRGLIQGTLQGIIVQATDNGTISVGRTLSNQQQLFIVQQSGDENAFRQVATSGYWIGVAFREEAGESIAVYTLIYAQDEVVRMVEGTHTLI